MSLARILSPMLFSEIVKSDIERLAVNCSCITEPVYFRKYFLIRNCSPIESAVLVSQ